MSPLAQSRAAAPNPARQQVLVDIAPTAGREDAAEPVRQVLQAIAPFVTNATVTQQDAVFRGVVDSIIASTPIRSLDAVRAALEQRAISAIFSGAEWLTADQVGRLRDPDARNPHGTANRWRTEGKVFALTKGGVLYYPRYVFDEVFDPRPVVAQVLAVLAGYSPYRLAAWFESTNSYLGAAARPRDVLGTLPEAVLSAAHDHVTGPLHG